MSVAHIKNGNSLDELSQANILGGIPCLLPACHSLKHSSDGKKAAAEGMASSRR